MSVYASPPIILSSPSTSIQPILVKVTLDVRFPQHHDLLETFSNHSLSLSQIPMAPPPPYSSGLAVAGRQMMALGILD